MTHLILLLPVKWVLLSSQVYPATLNIKEGVVKEMTFDPSDTTSTLYNDNYILIADYENIDNTSLFITTTTQTFEDVRDSVSGNPPIESLSLASATDEAYDVKYSHDGLRIYFGDSVYGEYPAGTLTIKYIESTGTDVDIQATNLDFAFESETLELDSDDQVTYNYTLKNDVAITGALDYETINVTKKYAPDYVRTAARAVTKHDFAYYTKASGVGGIVDAACYGEEEIRQLTYNMNNVYIVYLNSTGTELSVADEQALRAYMDIYKTITTHMVMLAAEVIELQAVIKINRNPNLTVANSELYEYIRSYMTSLFVFEDGSLNKDLYHSDLVQKLFNLTITKDEVTKKIADFVTVDLKGLWAFSTPMETQETTITIALGTLADNYSIRINSSSWHTHPQGGGDTADSIATDLAALIDVDADVSAVAVANVITVTTATPEVTFTIENSNSTQPLKCRVDQTINIPVSLLYNEDLDNLLLPSNVEIIDTTGSVIATDDGAGNIYNGTINYTSGELVIPLLVSDSYYVRFSQDADNNFMTTERQAIKYGQPKAKYTDVTELLSTIVIEG